MNQKPGPVAQWFARIAVLIVSVWILIGEASIISSAESRAEVDILSGFLLVVFACISCVAIWFSLFYRELTPRELADEAELSSGDGPRIPPDAPACRFSNFGKAAGVFIETTAERIHFQNCHIPRGFLTSQDSWFSCPISDVKAVHTTRLRTGRSNGHPGFLVIDAIDSLENGNRPYNGILIIITRVGTVRISSHLVDYSELHRTLLSLVPRNSPGFLLHHPAMVNMHVMIMIVSTLLGLFLGWQQTPPDSSDSTLGLYLLVGTTLGLCGSIVLWAAGDRMLQSSAVGNSEPTTGRRLRRAEQPKSQPPEKRRRRPRPKSED
jgi:hypothetical protein